MDLTFSKGFENFGKRVENMFEKDYPNIMAKIEGLSVGHAKDSKHRITRSAAQHAVFAAMDSAVGINARHKNEGSVINVLPNADTSRYVKNALDARVAQGMDPIRAMADIKDSLTVYQGINNETGKFDVMLVAPNADGSATDSLLEGLAIPMNNVGTLQKVFRQPFAPVYARDLVSLESFGNAWADVVVLYLEDFEGFGRISTTAKGSIEQTASSPVQNAIGMMATDVVNIAVDYESSWEEDQRSSGQPGNWLNGVSVADRERFAKFVLDRTHDVAILFGAPDAGFDGLVQASGGITMYPTASENIKEIVTGTSSTKGADIVQIMNNIIFEFLQENNFLPSEIAISVGTWVYRGLKGTTYSNEFNPSSPDEVIRGRFDQPGSLSGGGSKACAWTLRCDPSLDANSTFNDNDFDLMMLTVKKVHSALDGEQAGLVIAPELISNLVVPPMWKRTGYLYTMYKRVASVMAPIEGTVKVYGGVGESA